MITGHLEDRDCTNLILRGLEKVIYSFSKHWVQKILYQEYKDWCKILNFYKVICSTISYSKGREVTTGTSFKSDNSRGRNLRSSEILRSVEWLFRTDVSGPVGCPETSIGNCHFTLRKISGDLISHLHGGRSLTSRNNRGTVAKKAKFSTKKLHK